MTTGLAMTETDEPARRRKPLRRTAGSLFIGGFVVTGLMSGVGLLLLAGGEHIGPGGGGGMAGRRTGVRAQAPRPAERPVVEM